jgi:RNA polymerase sporulation-specific sigma factor
MTYRLSQMNLPRFPLLSDKEMQKLLKAVKQGDKEARERLVNCNLKLVYSLTQRFNNRGYDLEDLFQIGTIGLIKAIDKFDLNYDVKFSTYAVPMILGEIRRFLRDDSTIKISRSLKEIAFKVYKTKEDLTKQFGQEPSITEISEKLNIPTEDIIAAIEAIQTPSSIHETLYQDEGEPILLIDQLSNSKATEELWFDKLVIKDVLKHLPQKHRQIILLRFFYDKTQMEVAKIIGISQVQVSRIERQALKNIRGILEEPS